MLLMNACCRTKVRANKGMRVVGGALVEDSLDRPPLSNINIHQTSASLEFVKSKSHSSNKFSGEPAEDTEAALAAEDDVAFEVTAREVCITLLLELFFLPS